MPRRRAAAAGLLLASAGVVVVDVGVGVLGQSAPPVLPPASSAPAAEPAAPITPAPAARVAPVPECDAVMVISRAKCQFAAVNGDIARVIVGRPLATVIETVNGTTLRAVPFAGNGLRQLLLATFRADSTKPTSYANPPVVSVIVGSGRSAVSAEGLLVPSRENSVRASKNPQQKYTLQVQRGPDTADFATLSAGKCKVYIAAPCSEGCPVGEANFGAGCEGACPAGLSDFGAGCVVACPPGQVVSASGDTCVPQQCSFYDTQCPKGALCPFGTTVSAECAAPFGDGNPCACTALQQLAGMTATLLNVAPWNNLTSASYCNGPAPDNNMLLPDGLAVTCVTVGGVQLPTTLGTYLGVSVSAGLTGAVPPSVGDLGPLLKFVNLFNNTISSLPTEIGVLVGLTSLKLRNNDISSLPTEIGALSGLTELVVSYNALTSVPTEIGALTGSWDPDGLPGTLTGLESLDLADNRLTSVPTEIGGLTGLTYLDLSFNLLGSVPAEIGALQELEVLDFRDNKLTGLPSEFRTFNPSTESQCESGGYCYFYGNADMDCSNIGANTSCCTGESSGGVPGNQCGEGLMGGPCYS